MRALAAVLVLFPLLASAQDGGVPPRALECLRRYYAFELRQTADAGWGAGFTDGGFVPFEDGRKKTHDEALEHPDLADTLAQRYPREAIAPVTTVDLEPGRIRVDALFRATYGDSREEVERALVPFDFFGQKLKVHRKLLPAFTLARKNLEPLIAKHPEYRAFLTGAGGTFEWRNIAGTDRASVHSYGASIDLNVKRSNYWRWSKGAPKWQNQIPAELVRAFENAGFIWGGRWYHFDTMHFEYRPELFDPDCADGSAEAFR